jgi:hypothetical protein
MIGASAQSEDFQADLKLSKSVWFYHLTTHKRCLLLLVDAAVSLKDIRALGKKAATELASKKILSCHFLMSSSIQNLKEGAGNFVNAFDSANYEVSMKRPEEKKEGEDARTQRHEKNVETYSVHLEDESILASEPYKF